MTLYDVTIEKHLTGANPSKWTNVYHVDAADLAIALGHAGAIADIEAAIYWEDVQITRLGAKLHGVAGSGQSQNVAVTGERTPADPDTQLPLFNTVLYKFLPAIGRPSPKYLRMPLTEGEVLGFSLTTACTNFVSTNYAVPLMALAYMRDESGNAFVGYGFNPRVQMRQQGWHRRTRPGFHRGWVPD